MAGELKGLNYFPVDIHFFQCDKIAIIEADYGLKALAIVFKLLCRIYSEGFYMTWDERACKLFRLNACAECSAEELEAIVGALVREGFFSAECFERYGVLTSKGIQRRFFEAASRRKRMEIDRRELLLVELEGAAKKEAGGMEKGTEGTVRKRPEAMEKGDGGTMRKGPKATEKGDGGTATASASGGASAVVNRWGREDGEAMKKGPAEGAAAGDVLPGHGGEGSTGEGIKRFSAFPEKGNVDILGENADISSQRKGKEKRGKDSKSLSESTSELLPGAGGEEMGENKGTEVMRGGGTAEGARRGAAVVSSASVSPLSQGAPASAFSASSFAAHCRDWRDALLADEDWRASIVRVSGKGFPVLAQLGGAMALFEDHITTIGERATLRTAADYARRFVCWWRCLGFRPAPAIVSPAAGLAPAAGGADMGTDRADTYTAITGIYTDGTDISTDTANTDTDRADTETDTANTDTRRATLIAATASAADTVPTTATTAAQLPAAGPSREAPFGGGRPSGTAGRASRRYFSSSPSSSAPPSCRAEEAIQTSAAAAGIALQLIGEA